MKGNAMSGLKLLVSDRSGVYVPQRFFQDYNCEVWGIDPNGSDADTIWEGPHADWYWETWDEILDKAHYVDSNGHRWTLHQDGDLWAICPELMDDEEYKDFFGESRDLDNDEQARWYDTSAELA
jgi:hypothetical protein